MNWGWSRRVELSYDSIIVDLDIPRAVVLSKIPLDDKTVSN